MLLEIYVFISLIAFVTLFLSIILKNEGKNGETRRGNIPLAYVSFLIFGFLSFASMQIEYVECENQITWMNETSANENNTAITNNIGCITENFYDGALVWLMAGMGLLALIFGIIYTLRESLQPSQ